MPYDTIEELPKQVKDSLPVHAQEIFKAAFNNAWEQYKYSESRKGDDSREEVAFKIAWSAVKQKYEKTGGRWRSK